MADPYEGEEMHKCMLTPFDFRNTQVVVVSGDGINYYLCGHMILRAGSFYFHVAGGYRWPRYMTEIGYRRYLKETGKTELRRTVVKVPNPMGAHRKLEELLADNWFWGVLPHNCANFCEQVLQAGGSKAGLYSNCPQRETFK
jgi:hypothetical protein